MLIWQKIFKLNENYFNKIKIRISQLIGKILLKQWSLNQIRHCLTGHNKIWHHFFIKAFQWTSKSKFLNFMIKVNPNNVIYFSVGHIQIWRNFSLVAKYSNISMTFIICTFLFHCKSEHKQVKWIRSIYLKIYLKNEWEQFLRENALHLISLGNC